MIQKEIILEQYNTLVSKEAMSKFYKVDLHIHTPASKNDYKVDNKLYEKVTLDKLNKIAINKNLFKLDELSELSLSKDDLTALLIIHEAVAIKKLNMIVVTDHNNMDWYEKLLKATKEYFLKYNPQKILAKEFIVFPGVEITCFNGAHIIAILDPKDYLKKWNYLSFELSHKMDINNDIFTTKSELDVIQAIRKVDGIVYIPHIDNNNQELKFDEILNPLNGRSKAEVFTNKNVHAIGFTNYDRFKPYVENILNNKRHIYYRSTPLAFLQDSDAHKFEEIGTRYMHIKMGGLSFNSLKFALEDPDLRVKKDNKEKDDIPYINGIVTNGGFLCKPNGKSKYYPLDKDLNCIIGGRGTGKSTLVNCIKSCIEGKVESSSFRRFLGKFNYLIVGFHIDKKNYCLVCEPKMQFDPYTGDEIIINTNRTKQDQLNIENWIKLYEVSNHNLIRINVNRQVEILKNFHVDFFRQAQVYKIGENEEYLKMMFDNIFFRSFKKDEYSNLYDKLEKELKHLNKTCSVIAKDFGNIDAYKDCVEKIFNINKQLDVLREEIIYNLNNSLINKIMIKYIGDDFNLTTSLNRRLESHYNLNSLYDNKINDISKCITFLIEKYDFYTLWYNIDLDFDSLVDDILISDVLISEKVGQFIERVEVENYIYIIKELIFKHIKDTQQYKNSYNIEVKFNVNSYLGNGSSKLFKPLDELSLGQRAVAILLLITEGLSGVAQTFPIVIDQPEDHLDNKFIYEHLVKSIRKLKTERQVILVTHNPNIPVGGDSENIIYMESDNTNGWVELSGPIDNLKISEKILSIMEGGRESFNIRKNKYKTLMTRS